MSRSSYNPWLNRFAVFIAAATLVLIGIGGLVTSHEAGMSVPDWPTTYGYNMFLFPFPKWVGGIFFEHLHRLVASALGFLSIILAVWLWRKDCRPWLRWLGVAAVFLVVVQGVVGGLRVRLNMAQLGILHAPLAQLTLVTFSAIALFTTRWWRDLKLSWKPSPDAGLRRVILAGTILIFGQLMLGATMRHAHAGLSIPDFPLAYHKLWPPTDPASVALYNQTRLQVDDPNPITATQIVLQMVHRIAAVLILCVVAATAWLARRQLGARNPLSRGSLGWLALIVTQVILGAATIWSQKAADVATAHVVVGALSLAAGSILTILSFRLLVPARATSAASREPSNDALMSGPAAPHGAK